NNGNTQRHICNWQYLEYFNNNNNKVMLKSAGNICKQKQK
ncbi:hypothetical protein DOY81_000661, partial [Sarcophaga bullata]